jgi:hypothetical protein
MKYYTYINSLYFSLFLLFFIYFFSLYIHYNKAIISYSDTAFQFFYILQNEKFALFHLRFIAVFSQFFAYIGSQLSLDINLVMKAHLVNIVLLYLCCFLFFAFVLKRKYLALLILMLPSFMQHFSFYYPIHELMYGFCFFIIPISYIYFNVEKLSYKQNTLLAIASFLFCIFIHPFYNIIGILLLVVFIIFKKTQYKKWLVYILIGICILLLKIKLLSGHEKGHVNNFDFSIINWQKINSSYLTYFLKDTLNNRFYFLKYFYFISIIFLLVKKEYRIIFSSVLLFICIYLFVYLFLPNGYTLAYMEAYFLPLFASILFVFFLYLEEKFSRYSIVFSIIILPFCIFGLFRNKSERLYINRAKFIEKKCDENKHQCLFIQPNKHIEETLLVGWALPFESLILSTANGKSKTMYLNSELKDVNSIKDTTLMIGTDWYVQKFSELNPKYFYIQPQAYQIIE